jgi:hypothetical protein
MALVQARRAWRGFTLKSVMRRECSGIGKIELVELNEGENQWAGILERDSVEALLPAALNLRGTVAIGKNGTSAQASSWKSKVAASPLKESLRSLTAEIRRMLKEVTVTN